MCESTPPLEKPWCVQVCGEGALTYVEREVAREEPALAQMEAGIEALARQHGTKAILAALEELAKRKQ